MYKDVRVVRVRRPSPCVISVIPTLHLLHNMHLYIGAQYIVHDIQRYPRPRACAARLRVFCVLHALHIWHPRVRRPPASASLGRLSARPGLTAIGDSDRRLGSMARPPEVESPSRRGGGARFGPAGAWARRDVYMKLIYDNILHQKMCR